VISLSPILTNVLIFLALGIVLGAILTIAAKVFEVKVDPRVEAVREVLPGANCGACGEVGCDNFAAAVVAGTQPVDGCPVGGAEGAIAVANVMGVEVDLNATRKVARVRCKGTYTDSKEKYNYSGIADCFAASQVFAGHKECQYGCLGHGTCAKACPFGAIDIVDRVAVINEDKCQACEKCISACPKQLIEMVPVDKRYTVGCRSLDKGGVVRKYCSVGCIGCTLCVKACPVEAITMQGAVAYIDPTKCINCGACEKKCPTKAIWRVPETNQLAVFVKEEDPTEPKAV
jgi:electron transport complex protein RnfB